MKKIKKLSVILMLFVAFLAINRVFAATAAERVEVGEREKVKEDTGEVLPTEPIVTYDYEYFIKTNDDGAVVTDAEFAQKSLNGKISIPLVFKEEAVEIGKKEAKKVKEAVESRNIPFVATSIDGKYKYISRIDNTSAEYFLDLLTSEQRAVFDNLKTYDDFVAVEARALFKINENTCINNNYKAAYINYLSNSKGISIPLMKLDDLVEKLEKQVAEVRASEEAEAKKNVRERIPAEDEEFKDDVAETVGKEEAEAFEELVKEDEASYPEYVWLSAKTFMLIEETKTPIGYEKQIMVVPMSVSFKYSVDRDGNLTLVAASAIKDDALLKYDSNINYNSVSDYQSKLTSSHKYLTTCSIGDVQDEISYFCELNPVSRDDSKSEAKEVGLEKELILYMKEIPTLDAMAARPERPTCYPIVINKKGQTKFEIETYVNGKTKEEVIKKEKVTYSVKLLNDSMTPAYNNTVVSKLPKEFKYVEGSANKNGVYDKASHTITWSLDYLDARSAEVFAYQVTIPDSIDARTVYTSTATVRNDTVEIPVTSNKSEATLGVKNPKTGSIIGIVLISILCVSLVIYFITSKKKLIKKI